MALDNFIMKFCNTCNHVLKEVTNHTELYYQCNVCMTKYPSDPSDTLRYSQSFQKKNEIGGKGAFITHAAYDITNPKIFKKCPNCEKEIITSIVSGDEMTFSYLCECGYSSK